MNTYDMFFIKISQYKLKSCTESNALKTEAVFIAAYMSEPILFSQFAAFVTFKENSCGKHVNTLTLQLLPLSAGSSAVLFKYFWVTGCRESTQIPSLRLFRNVLPRRLPMESSAPLRQMSLHVQNILVHRLLNRDHV